MLSIIVRIPILNSQCIYFVHSKMIRNAHRLLNSMAVHPGPLPQERGKHAQFPGIFTPFGVELLHGGSRRRLLSGIDQVRARASCLASRMAARMLEGSALSWPAMS